MAEKKTYLTTGKAGPRVAGRHVPYDDDGKTLVGFPLELTDREAEYELAQGTIEPKAAEGAEGQSSTPADDTAAAKGKSRGKQADAPADDPAQGA
ncbi:MAG: hypothetical protein QM651_18095 [Rhodoblastus sp.]